MTVLNVYNSAMSDQSTSPRADLRRALARGFRESYDRMGYVLAVSFLWFLAVAVTYTVFSFVIALRPLLPDALKAAFLAVVALAGYIWALGVFYYANRVVFRRDPAPMETLTGIRRLFWPGLKLFLADLAVTAVLVADSVFFFVRIEDGFGYLALAVFSFYVTLMWLVVSMYHLPLLAAQLEMDSGPGTWVVVKKSLLIAADNPGFTLGLFVVIIALTALAVLPMLIGMAVFFLGVLAFILTHAIREIFTKYGIVEQEPDNVADGGWPAS